MNPSLVPCPLCGKSARIARWDSRDDVATIKFDCGHSVTTKVEKFNPKAPSPPQLRFTEHDKFGTKVQNSGNKHLADYHETTRYRMDIAEYCLKHLLNNYDNGIAFAAGLTGFLVQVKAALDSLCEEIHEYYGLKIKAPTGQAVDSERLLQNIGLLVGKNTNLANLLQQQLGSRSSWFRDFKDFRDHEGTHRKRTPRNLVFGKAQEIEVYLGGKKVAVGPYCVSLMQTINRIIEDAYKLM